MISRKNRFHGYGSLNFVYRHGRVVRGPLFALKFSPNPKRDQYRLAVVVSKKVSKSAVKRNRIRRRLYESMRHMAGRVDGPYDIILNVYNESVLDEAWPRLNRQLEKQLAEAGILEKT